MAKTKSRQAAPPPEENEEIDLDAIAPDPDAVEDYNKLAGFLEQFGGKEYKVRVDQYNKLEKVWEFIDTFPLDGFDAFDTCKRFGGGRYRMTFLNEKGKYVQGGQPQIRIAAGVVPAVPLAAPAVDNDPLKNPLFAMMLANAERAATQSTELLKVLLAKPEPAKSSTMEVFELMAKLKHMTPEDTGMKKLQEALMMRMIEKGLDGGDSGGEKSVWEEVKEGLKDAKDLGIFDRLAAGIRRPQAPRSNPPATPAPGVTVALPTKEPAPVLEDPMTQALRPYAVIFANKAATGAAPEEAAGYLVDEFYDSVIPLIRKHVAMSKFMSEAGIVEYACGSAQDPEQVEKLYVFAPELAAHREWVGLVITEAVKLIMNEGKEEPNGNQAEAQA